MVRPPSNTERKLYFSQGRRVVYGVGVVSTLTLATGALLFLGTHPVAVLLGPVFLLTFFYLFVTYFIGLKGRPYLSPYVGDLFPLYRLSESVDVYLPIAGESIDVLRNTWSHVAEMVKYSRGVGRRLLRVYVLDDAQTPQVDFLLEDFPEFQVIRRVPKGKLKKAGNLRNAFFQTSGDWILVLDADFAPREDMIERLMTLARGPRIGVVVSPQYFDYKGSLVERGAAAVQELFYRLLQVNRNTFGAAVVTGTNCLYRREALAPHGGTYPIEYSEDLHTGFQCLVDGWEIRYTPQILAKGLCPSTVRAFFSQQYRWCMGSTTLLMRRWFWKAPLTATQKLCFLTGFFYYIATALGLFFLHVPSLLVLYLAPEKLFYWNYVFSLPSFIFGTVVLWFWNKTPYTIAAHVCRQIQSLAHAMCLFDKIRGKTMGWVVTGGTPTVGSESRFQIARVVYGISVLGSLGAFGFGISAYLGAGYDKSNLIILMPLLLWHYLIAGVGLSTLWGRK